jgi:hypothetical protein
VDLDNVRESVALPPENLQIKQLIDPLYQAKGWLKLLGILTIVSGALSVLSLWGILMAWLPIWMGILLLKAGRSIEAAQVTGDKIEFIECLNKLKVFFTIQGVMMLVVVIITLVGLMVFGGALIGLMSQMSEMSGSGTVPPGFGP